jgi:hypothetical protein
MQYGRSVFDDDDKSSVGDADEMADAVHPISAASVAEEPLLDSGTAPVGGEADIPAVRPSSKLVQFDEPTSTESADAVTQPLSFHEDGYYFCST